MTDSLRTRIAAVQRLHQWRATVRASDDDPVLDCSCGIAFGGALDCERDVFDSHREHVADAVIRELGLRLDLEHRVSSYIISRMLRKFEVRTRWVTGWSNWTADE